MRRLKLYPAAAEDGIGAVAVPSLEVVAVHAVLFLDVADHRGV